MTGGHIDGREINALTINADDVATTSFTFEGGWKICLHAGHMKAVVRGIAAFVAPAYCDTSVTTQRTLFCIPAKRDCAP